MNFLLINTCSATGTAALASASGVLAAEALPGRGTSEALMPAIRRLFPAGTSSLDAIAVVNGPGSFTGVRVGLSAAKGLCDARNIPMIAISRLALVAAAVEAPAEVAAVLDAGRGEFFVGLYTAGQCISEQLLDHTQTQSKLAGRTAVTCEERVADRLNIRLVPEPGAELMRRMAVTRAAAGDWNDVATIDANYLRRTDAELLVNAT